MNLDPERFTKLVGSAVWASGGDYITIKDRNFIEIHSGGITLHVWAEAAASPMRKVVELSHIRLVEGPDQLILDSKAYQDIRELIQKMYREKNYPCEIVEPENVPHELRRVSQNLSGGHET